MTNKLNYGLLKYKYKVDLNRFNWDYIKGIIDTDGCVKSSRGWRVVICQTHKSFIRLIKIFIEDNFNVKGKIYMEGKQLSFSGELFYNFINNYKIKDFNSYYAGVIDGDGCFCEYNSPSVKYWRFQLGASKPRKLKIFKEFFLYYGFQPTKYKNVSNNCIMYSLNKKEDVLALCEIMKNYLIIKKFVIDLVSKQIIKYKNKKEARIAIGKL